jgi:hypothetical protein
MSGQRTSLSWAKRVTGLAGLAVGVGMTMSLALGFSLTPAVIGAVGIDAIAGLYAAAAWLTIIGSLATLIGFGWGRWLSRPFWAKGLAPLLLGLGLGWGWYLLNRYVDLWGVTAQVNAGAEVPSLGWGPTVVTTGVSVIATVLVWIGAIRVLSSSLASEPAPTQPDSQAV